MQTALFAEYFLHFVRFPRTSGTLLDFGCALGDALLHFHQQYPHLTLCGCDFSPVAVDQARQKYGVIAKFHEGTFDDLTGHYDMIYCSNTLEHFSDPVQKAGLLLRHCDWLFVLVPYLERNDGKPLAGPNRHGHCFTFTRNTFAFLVKSGSARSIRCRVRYMPGAWGFLPSPWWSRFKRILRGKHLYDPRQAIFVVQSQDTEKRGGDE